MPTKKIPWQSEGFLKCNQIINYNMDTNLLFGRRYEFVFFVREKKILSHYFCDFPVYKFWDVGFSSNTRTSRLHL